jgi:REP element-mobilizing transposase RayT
MPDNPIRKSIRLPGHDYASPGVYFITVCTHQRACLFGAIAGDIMHLNAPGALAQTAWLDTPRHFPNVDVDTLMVMPNHLHAILILHHMVGAKHASPLPVGGKAKGTSRGSLPAVVQAFKSAAARRINADRGTPGAAVWQRGYFEHIIRTPDDLDRLRRYIESNPLRWALDRENPANT